ncbi:hypothetical protein TREVI0001_0667 [Treponema vincentii ATCC 35580]|uniref:Uncharacterized protein n=1 Tax=Treponema vincentii ATCC 35580 TaxID=596324 RepID=C8PMP9_9SPIR|nr:hypothetical protein TREVI0001_0667 [Treponema vincentii ATCC 35580]
MPLALFGLSVIRLVRWIETELGYAVKDARKASKNRRS